MEEVINSAASLLSDKVVTRDEARAAFEEFVRLETSSMLRLAGMLLRNQEEARDLVQDAQIRAFVSLDSFRWESSLKTWVTRIMINQGLKKLRHRKVRDRVASWFRSGKTSDYPAPAFGSNSGLDPEQAAVHGERIQVLHQALKDLSPRQQTVLVLRFLAGRSVSDIAELMGIGPGTVKTHLVRAVRQVRAYKQSVLGDDSEESDNESV